MTKRTFCSLLLHYKHLACVAAAAGSRPSSQCCSKMVLHAPYHKKVLPAIRCCEDLFSPLTDSSMERLCCSAVYENSKHVIKFQWIPKQSRFKLRHWSLWPQSSKTLQCMNKPTLNSPVGKSVGTTHCFKLGICSRDLFDVATVPHSKCCLEPEPKFSLPCGAFLVLLISYQAVLLI